MADAARQTAPIPGWYGSFLEEGKQPEDPYPGFRELRETQPVNLTPDGLWRLSRYEDVRCLLRTAPAGVRRTDGQIPGEAAGMPGGGSFMLLQDPPNHTRLRKLVSKAFTPRAIEAWRPRAEAVTHALLDRVAAKGEMDLVADLAMPVPATLICELMGVAAEDHERFTRWTATATHRLVTLRGRGGPELKRRVDVASAKIGGYLTRLIAERRDDPRDDLLSALVAAEEEGERLTELELLAQSVGLLIAGFETTIGLIGNGLVTLIRNPDELARLRAEPGLVESAVEECLRYSGPVLATVRVMHADAEFGGWTVPANAEVLALLAAANRDPEAFDDPERFDVTRYTRDAQPHLALGSGAHFCMGAHLARLEAQVAIGALVARFDELALCHETIEWGLSIFRVPARVPIRFVERPSPRRPVRPGPSRKAMAARFLDAGMRVVLADVEAAALDAAARELGAGPGLIAVPTDVTRADAVDALAERTLDAYGAVHVVCNNAGVFTGGLCWETPLPDWRWVFGVNV
ncbi:MAG TPA: cytochrome P450, partial [Myxococcota bacterium]|nr:cytochrome P450 [Myxococcota bacterium]